MTTTYTVHLYREMRMVFRDIEAANPEAAARFASAKASDDCEGLAFSALVDPEGGDPSDGSHFVHLRADGGEIEPSPTQVTNRHRAKWADAALKVFMQHTGCDREEALGDLLANLMHLSEQEPFDFDLALSRAKYHFEEELDEEEMAGAIAAVPELLDALKRAERFIAGFEAEQGGVEGLLSDIRDALTLAKGGAQ